VPSIIRSLPAESRDALRAAQPKQPPNYDLFFSGSKTLIDPHKPVCPIVAVSIAPVSDPDKTEATAMSIIQLPTRWRIESTATGEDYGEHRGWTEDQALDRMARHAGFPDLTLMCQAQGLSRDDGLPRPDVTANLGVAEQPTSRLHEFFVCLALGRALATEGSLWYAGDCGRILRLGHHPCRRIKEVRLLISPKRTAPTSP